MKKDKIEVNVYTFTDADGNVVYDFESTVEELEDKLSELAADQNIFGAHITEDDSDEKFKLEMEELKAKQKISNEKEDGTIALA